MGSATPGNGIRRCIEKGLGAHVGQIAVTVGYESRLESDATARRLKVFYTIEGIASFAACLLMVGIFFFTTAKFGWGLRENFLLAAVQGAVYVCGALMAGKLAERVGRRTLLTALYVGMASVASLALLSNHRTLVIAVLLAYTVLSAAAWPALESLVSTGAPPHELSRRLG